jgi:threonyl-tRNA synthetase
MAMSELSLTFPDGSKRSFQKGLTGAELAAGISKSLAKKAVAISLDGRLADLADPSRRMRRSRSSPAPTRKPWS